MKTESVSPETIISGFSHFLWILMIALVISKSNIQEIFTTLSQISTGAIIILASIVLGTSFFLGTLVNRILSDLIGLFKKDDKIKNLNEAVRQYPEKATEYYNSWKTKHFFLSMAIALLIIFVAAIWIDCSLYSGKKVGVIMIIGIPIVIATFIAFITQMYDFHKLRQELLSNAK